MTDLAIPTDPKSAMHVVCLFMAQRGEPHADLGYKTQRAALEDIASIFGVAKRTVQSARDSYDHFTPSARVGWKADTLRQTLQTVFDKYSTAERDTLLNLSQEILDTSWSSKVPDFLPDLEECQKMSRERAALIPLDQVYVPPKEVWDIVISSYKSTGSDDKLEIVGGTTLVFNTPMKNFLTVSSQEIPRCWAVRPYVLAILAYADKVDELAKALGYKSRSSGRAKNEIFKRLPATNAPTPNGGPQLTVSSSDMADITDAVKNKLNLDDESQARFIKFLNDGNWSGLGKTLERPDWRNNAILSTGGWLVAAADRRGELSIALSGSDRFEELMNSASLKLASPKGSPFIFPDNTSKGGENVIFYGAPGTGKSDRVEKEIKKAGKRPFRTVFHPDLQNSDFFGCLKPQMDGKTVHYGFSPGPFMKALAEAYKEPAEKVFLVIEELNRAAAAAVFGDLFLLLDRDDDGMGEYDVSFPSPESEQWFEKETGTAHEALLLPSNLFIYATMNSADQGVYPIDTAFRRRWRQEYLPLNYESGPDGDVAYVDTNGKHHSLAWREFVKSLNEYLTGNQILDIAEDRLLGQWFVKQKELDGKSIPDKVLLYLWDDLLRHEGRELIFDEPKTMTYGKLALRIKNGERILSDHFLTELNKAPHIDTFEAEETIKNAD
jgi:hypothetical protein